MELYISLVANKFISISIFSKCEDNTMCESLMKVLQIHCFVAEMECAPDTKEIFPDTELIAQKKYALL